MAGVLNRALTTVDSVRHIVLWMDTWKTDANGQAIEGERISPPPIGVPVPVKPGGPPPPVPQSAPATVAGPQQHKQIDMSIFESSN